MKYRIVQDRQGWYYVQMKFLGIWWFTYNNNGQRKQFHTEQSCEFYLQNYIKDRTEPQFKVIKEIE